MKSHPILPERSSKINSMERNMMAQPRNQQPGTVTLVNPVMPITRKQKRPSAYQYYQKLVQDFDILEREMESHQEEQHELEAQLERARAKIRAQKDEDQQVQRLQWEQERDRQLEAFVEQHTTLDALRAQTEELDAQELRLQAEIEVLREKQQEASETEARRIRRLVHDRTTLLEDELAKGKLDLDYIAYVVSTARRQEIRQEIQRESNNNAPSSVESLVQDIQERRQRDLKAAEANFQERMRSFQLEKDALAKKAKELKVAKHQALQILSQNQQLAIQGFFDKSSPTSQGLDDKTADSPSLDFGEILQSLNQSGAQVEQIQAIDSERNSGRRDLADALKEAHATLERGTQRVEAIQKSLDDRRAEAQKLGVIVPGTISTGYDGAWRIETYSPQQYETVYFMRGLVFSWMDAAIAEISAQPAKQLLELEFNRWRATHSSIEHDRDRDRNLHLAGHVLTDLVKEVITEIAADIRSEFESSAYRVRNVFSSVFKSALIPTPGERFVSPQTKKAPAKTPVTAPASTPTLRALLFESSLDHLRKLRNRRNASKSTGLLHRCSLPVSQRQPTTAIVSPPPVTKSPAKKAFVFFSSLRGGEPPLPKKEALPQPQGSIFATSKLNDTETVPLLLSEAPSSPPAATSIALTFWQNEPHLRLRTMITPSSLGYCSCLQVSPNGDLLISGTTEGDLIVWDLQPDQPTIFRVWSPPKAERSRITRVSLSPDAQLVIAFFRRKTVGVFTINPQINTNSQTKPKQAVHTDDCFPGDTTKSKPRSLELLTQISAAGILAELSFTPELRERAPNAVAKDPATGWSTAELSCGLFFTSFSLTGLASWNSSILCGASTGDLVKFNLNPQRESGGAQLHNVQAAFDSPSPNDTKLLDTKAIRREFFRSHRRPVLFVSCIHRQSNESKHVEILSVDQDGVVCLWEYSTENFTGFGWFEPSLRLRLELTCSITEIKSSSLAVPTPSAPKHLPPKRLSLPPAPDNLEGELLQVALTPDNTRLVCLVFYPDPTKKEVAGTLRFLQVLTPTMRLDQMKLNVNFVGGNGAPRFALTTNFLLVLAQNLVRIYILRTGKEAREPVIFSAPGQPQLVFNNITCATSPKSRLFTKLGSPTKTAGRDKTDPTTITFVVSGDQHSHLLVHSFTASTPQSPVKKMNTKRVR